MSIIAQLVIMLGISIFLTGYWFLGKNSGLQECNQEDSILSDTYKGGSVAASIGIILMLGGLIIFYGKSNE